MEGNSIGCLEDIHLFFWEAGISCLHATVDHAMYAKGSTRETVRGQRRRHIYMTVTWQNMSTKMAGQFAAPKQNSQNPGKAKTNFNKQESRPKIWPSSVL